MIQRRPPHPATVPQQRAPFRTTVVQRAPHPAAAGPRGAPLVAQPFGCFGTPVRTVREEIQEHLKTFADRTSGGVFAFRPACWKSADRCISTVAQLPLTTSTADFYNSLIINLARVEHLVAGVGLDEDRQTRRAGFARWKAALVDALDAVVLRERMTAFAETDGTEDLLGNHRYINIGPDQEETPLAWLCGNRYGAFNRALRNARLDDSDRKSVLLSAAVIMSHFKQYGYSFASDLRYATSRGQLRYAGTLFDGSTPNADHPPERGTILQDPGWSFFGAAGADGVDRANRVYRINAHITRAVAYQNGLYGVSERGDEWVTLPGSKFRFDGYQHGSWMFTQVIQ